MRPGGGKEKGASFERQVCRDLSGWISKGERDDLFWRSAMSGGRATAGAKHGILRPTQTGDISSLFAKGDIHEGRAAIFIREVVAECKFLADLRLEHYLFNDAGPIALAWHQAYTTAKANRNNGHPRCPFLVLRQNRKKTLVITSLRVFDLVGMPANLRLRNKLGDEIVIALFEEYLTKAKSELLDNCPKRV